MREDVRPTKLGNPSAVDTLALIYAIPYISFVTSTAVLEAIAEPTRRRILDAVRVRERSVGDLVEHVGMPQPGVSRHLRILREAGLVEVRRDAQRRLYRLRPEPLRELDAWLEPFRAEWEGRIDALEQHLQRASQGRVTGPPAGLEEETR